MLSSTTDTQPSATPDLRLFQMPPNMAQAVTGDEKHPSSRAADEESQPHLVGQGEKEPQLSALPAHTDDDVVPTTKLQFLVIFIALILAIFCVALDNTIIVTAIPHITDSYKTLSDVGW